MRIVTLTLFAAALSLSQIRAQPAAKVLSVQGTVEVQQSPWAPAQLDQLLDAGTTIRTGDRSRAALLLADETQLKVNSNSQLTLTEVRRSSNLLTRVSQSGAGADQSILNVTKGQLWLRSKKSPAQVQVKTPAVTAAIRGTEIDVRVSDDGESFATVLEGSIEMSNDFGAILVNAGELGRARVGEAPTKMVILNPEDAVQWTLVYTAVVSPRDYPFFGPGDQPAAADPISTAKIHHDRGDLAGALAALGAVSGPEAAELRGWIFLEQNRLAEALEQLREAPANSWRTRLALSLAHYRANEMAQAYHYLDGGDQAAPLRIQRALLNLIDGDPGASREALAAVPDSDPYYSMAQGLLSNVHLTQNRKDEALAAAQRAVQAAPHSPSAHLSLSLVQQSRFELPAATRSARQALELDPAFLQAQIQYARLLFGAGDTGQAEKILRSAIESAPQEASAHSALGFVFLARGQTEEARAAFNRSIQLDSTNGEPRLGLGIAGMREGETTLAVEQILNAATLSPQMALFQSYLGKAFFEERKFQQAFTALQAAMELDPRDPTPHLYQGIFSNDLNRPGEAVQSLQESIRLNDNRAVYRTRFLLDEDRATRNVDLARIFNRLGLTEWGNSAALTSTLTDPTNSAARLFLAGTFLNLRGGTLSGGSERLMARLLQPVNPNSFNSFNDYTTLFELPRLYWAIGGGYGSFDHRGATLLASGGTRRAAFSSLISYDQTAGFRPVNGGSRDYNSTNLLKVALTPHSDLFFGFRHQQSRGGDQGVGSTLVSEENDPNLAQFFRINNFEIGFHQQFRPGSDAVLYFSGQDVTQLSDNPDHFPNYQNTGIDFALRRTLRSPNLSLQGAHLLKLDKVQFKYGFDIFEGKTRAREVLSFLFPSDPPEHFEQEFSKEQKRIRYKAAFLQSDYLITPNLVLTGGLTYDWANDDNFFADKDESAAHWSPQAAILYQPTGGTTLRFAAAEFVQTHFQERLVPTHLLGFPLSLNETPLSRVEAYSAGWDQRFGKSSFLRGLLFHRSRRAPLVGLLPDGRFGAIEADGDYYGAEAVWNQLLAQRVSLVLKYFVNRSLDVFSLRHDHEAAVGLFYIDPRGFSLFAEENYLDQFGRLGRVPLEVRVFTTSAGLSYEFPQKIGLASLRVTNLFDRRYQYLADPLALDPRVPRRRLEFNLSFFF